EPPHAGRTARGAADDGDPHRVVEAARKDKAYQGGAAVAGRERKRRGPLVRPEQPSPAERLERLGEEQQQPCCHKQPRSPLESGQEEVAKWRAVNSASAIATAPYPTANAWRPLRERRRRMSAPTSRRYLPSSTIGAAETAIAAS